MYNIMSNVCCKEFTGWFKSFTKIERALAVLEAILLVALVVLLMLLVLHLIVCSKPDHSADATENRTTPTAEAHSLVNGSSSGPYQTTKSDFKPYTAVPNGSNTNSDSTSSDKELTERDIKCSWTPSAKTTPAVHYYEDGSTDDINIYTKSPTSNEIITLTNPEFVELQPDATIPNVSHSEDFIMTNQSDGEEADDKYRSYVVALVKLKPPKDIIFGCILTIVSQYWTLTAASCIEAIEEIDSLDSFVIMEQYGTDKKGPLQAVEDVQIHPLYEGKNLSYDLAALKSAGSLIKGTGSPVKLASFLDYALLTLGERLTILGYGAFRSIDKSATGRRMRAAHVHVLSARRCGGGGGGGVALRHLWAGRGGGGGGGACGAAPLCAGVVRGRALPCNYCSGAPLVRGARLLAVMADNPVCGVACEPRLYVNVALLADWISATLRGHSMHST